MIMSIHHPTLSKSTYEKGKLSSWLRNWLWGDGIPMDYCMREEQNDGDEEGDSYEIACINYYVFDWEGYQKSNRLLKQSYTRSVEDLDSMGLHSKIGSTREINVHNILSVES